MSWLPSYWCRTCGPFTLNLEHRPDLTWRLDVCADQLVIHTVRTKEGTNLTMAHAKAWAIGHVKILFQGWLDQAEAIEWRE